MQNECGGVVGKPVFWDAAWISADLTRRTEMLDRVIPHVAVEFSYKLLGDIAGKTLLEVGCGSGLQTVEFCNKGAVVTAIDVSDESVVATKTLCKKENIKKVSVEKVNAESLPYKNNSFDRVYISRMLMHANQEKVLSESIRVLKKGGVLVVTEVLKHWLFAFPYRTFSPYRKTNPEYITWGEVKKSNVQHREFYLLSTAFIFLFYLPLSQKIARTVFDRLAAVDEVILAVFPFLRGCAWTTVFWMRK